jgi:hypothetical protein
VLAVFDDRGTVGLNALDLTARGVYGDDQGRPESQARRGPGHARAAIPGRGRRERPVVSTFDLSGQGAQGASHLVRTGLLEVLQLEPRPPPGTELCGRLGEVLSDTSGRAPHVRRL